MTAPVHQHSGPEMQPEEPGGRQAINPQTPTLNPSGEGERNIQKLRKEVNYLCSLPEDDESVCLALHLKATLDLRASLYWCLEKVI